jgi:hypothetical protein
MTPTASELSPDSSRRWVELRDMGGLELRAVRLGPDADGRLRALVALGFGAGRRLVVAIERCG